MRKHIKGYWSEVLFIGLSLFIGFIGSLLTKAGMPAYALIRKPWFTPPSAVFPIVWTILFVLMGYGMARVWKARTGNLPAALALFAVQLLMNLFWNLWFFTLQWYLLSFVWLVGLIAAVSTMIGAFHTADPPAAKLQIPYLVWLCFAAVLNLSIYLLN